MFVAEGTDYPMAKLTDEEIREERARRLAIAVSGCTSDEQRLIRYQQFCMNELMEQNNMVLKSFCAAKQELFENGGGKGGFLCQS